MTARIFQYPNLSWIQILVYTGGVLPAVWLIWNGLNNNLTVNPIQALTQRTGDYALIFLLLSLSCTPIYILFGYREVLKVRRPLGLLAFFYAVTHFILFVGVDYGFDLKLLSGVLLEKPYAIVGLVAFLILLLLAITSFRWWMKKLGKMWKNLHRLVYLAGILVVVHFFWVAKGDFVRLSGDIIEPLISSLFLTFLLVVRIPWIKKRIVSSRMHRMKRPSKNGEIKATFQK